MRRIRTFNLCTYTKKKIQVQNLAHTQKTTYRIKKYIRTPNTKQKLVIYTDFFGLLFTNFYEM